MGEGCTPWHAPCAAGDSHIASLGRGRGKGAEHVCHASPECSGILQHLGSPDTGYILVTGGTPSKGVSLPLPKSPAWGEEALLSGRGGVVRAWQGEVFYWVIFKGIILPAVVYTMKKYMGIRIYGYKNQGYSRYADPLHL